VCAELEIGQVELSYDLLIAVLEVPRRASEALQALLQLLLGAEVGDFCVPPGSGIPRRDGRELDGILGILGKIPAIRIL
jgi:hypothetical protein